MLGSPAVRRSMVEGEDFMGKGDRRTRRGKIWRKSFGKARPRNPDKPETVVATPAAPAKKPPKKATKKVSQ